MKTISRLIIIFFFLSLFMQGRATAVAEEIPLIVSIYPLEDITKNIGRQRVIIKTLIPPGASPHAFEPSPADIKELTTAKLFIKIGAGLEFWAERFVKAAKRDIKIIDLSETIPLLKGFKEECEGIHEHHDHKHHHDHTGADPHYWLDPVLVKSMVDRITTELIRIDPAGKDFYIENAQAYKKRLGALHEEIKKRLSTLQKREFVAFHPAWNYFSKRYGLKPLYIVEAAGRELRPGSITEIIKFIKKKNIKVLFSEPQMNPGLVEALARESGARILMLDPLGSPEIPGRDHYIDLMRYNLSQLEEALR